MASISSIFADRGTGPYSKALKVKVVAVDGEPLKYRGKDGSQRAFFASFVSDGEIVVCLTCYDSTKFAKFKVGTTLVLRDIIRRMDNSQQAVVVTSATMVLMSAPIDVPDSHTAEGMQMLHPPPADKVPLMIYGYTILQCTYILP